MNDIDYINKVENLLVALEAACDRMNDLLDIDIDNQRSGNMITLRFENASEIIINSQKPLQEVWLASLAGGFHYRLKDGIWIDTKSGGEFFAQLSQCASEQAGQKLVFSALNENK